MRDGKLKQYVIALYLKAIFIFKRIEFHSCIQLLFCKSLHFSESYFLQSKMRIITQYTPYLPDTLWGSNGKVDIKSITPHINASCSDYYNSIIKMGPTIRSLNTSNQELSLNNDIYYCLDVLTIQLQLRCVCQY